MRSSVGIANSHGAKGALVRRIGATRIGCASPRFSVGPIGMGAIDGKFAQARTFRHLDRQCRGISRLEASSAIFIVRIDGHYALDSRGAGRPTLNFRSKRSQHQRRLHTEGLDALAGVADRHQRVRRGRHHVALHRPVRHLHHQQPVHPAGAGDRHDRLPVLGCLGSRVRAAAPACMLAWG